MEKYIQIIKDTLEPNIKLSKLAKGNFSWVISMSGKDTKKLIEDIKKVNNQMKKEFVKGRV